MKRSPVIQYAVQLPFSGPPVLATGGYLRNTLCITNDNVASVSRVLGDLDSAAKGIDHEVAATEMMIWQGKIPAAVARDLNPDFHSTRFAIDLASNLGVSNLVIQHHHAHIAAICAEHLLLEPVIGLIFDNDGYGSDGGSWGGELMWVDGAYFERLEHLTPMVMPGGDVVLREPWRMAASALYRLQRTTEIPVRYGIHPGAADLASMINEARNCPTTTCMRWLIEAAASFLRLSYPDTLERDANLAMEAAAIRYFSTGDYAPVAENHWQIDADGQLDFFPLLARLADESNAEHGAAMFHACLIAGATEWVERACSKQGIKKVVIGGACMLNRLLANGLRDNLTRRGLTVYQPRQVLADDSALSLGQAWIAVQSLKAG